MSQFGLEDKVCHFLIGDDLLMLIYVCACMLTRNVRSFRNFMLIDIIVHDTWVICMSRIVHITFIIYVTWYRHDMEYRIAYEQGHRMKWMSVHGYNQHCVLFLIGWARYGWTTSNSVARLYT